MSGESKCGYVALVGRPNVGKSTLMNHLLGQKLAITSRKPQTTRHTMLGVDTQDNVQVIYVDTPGIHTATDRAMNRYMVRGAVSVLSDVDLVVMIVDADKWVSDDDLVLSHVKRAGTPAMVAINKMDTFAQPEQVLAVIEQLRSRHDFSAYLPISALKERGLEGLRSEIAEALPVAEHLFPADQLTDKPMRFLVAEIIREKLMRRLGEELPHHLSVTVEQYRVEGSLVRIAANIIVERRGQKIIVIGSKGARLKAIGSEARQDIEALIDAKVMLNLWVKVKPGWSNDEASLRRYGYD